MSKQLDKLIETGIGYRNSNISTTRRAYTAKDVFEFEIAELGNTDIPETLYSQTLIDKPTKVKAIDFIKELELARGTRMFAMWLCSSPDDVRKYYFDIPGDDFDDLDSEDIPHVVEELSVYKLPEWYIVASDLGDQGILLVSDSNFRKEYLDTIYLEDQDI